MAARTCSRCNLSTRPMGGATGGRTCLFCESEEVRAFVLSHPTTRIEFLRACYSGTDVAVSMRIRSMLLLHASHRVPTVNIDLMRRTLTEVQRDPDRHDQSVWAARPVGADECGTAYCMAGHALHLVGLRFDWDTDPARGQIANQVVDRNGALTPINLVAQRELGLLSDEANYLFAAERTRDELSQFANELVAFQQTLDSLPERADPFKPDPGHPVHQRWQVRTGRNRSLRLAPLPLGEVLASAAVQANTAAGRARVAGGRVLASLGLTPDETDWLAAPNGDGTTRGALQTLVRAELAHT